MTEHLLEVSNLKFSFKQNGKSVKALRSVSFALDEGSFCAVAGESGCGKSTLARILCGALTGYEGEVRIEGTDLKKAVREPGFNRRVQYLSSNPLDLIPPHFKLGKFLTDCTKNFFGKTKEESLKIIASLFASLDLPLSVLDKRCHEASLGQLQRVLLCRSLLCQSKLLILDEITSGLDAVNEQALLRLLTKIRLEHGLTMLFISHNLEAVRQSCDRILVMYIGSIVEDAPIPGKSLKILNHPYSQSLLLSEENFKQKGDAPFYLLQGDPVCPVTENEGCDLYGRCPSALPCCKTGRPLLRGDGAHLTACFLREN